ncbi:Membrane protein insertase YidC [uncultured Desulfobacterium sp.]|uniref:Membrane protein insertase YidC n=1 Tax=uncultured Desulfobacterium sp. TaxID=201089 RepID=A0A445N388_9BACT|nr:Membrane protein insertase YidC [uncultured Desulfobacterium sp.]
MEKRTILAFVLSFLVLLIWSHFFTTKQDKTVREKPPASHEQQKEINPDISRAGDESSPASSQGQVDQVSRECPKIEEKEIIVDTPLYKAVFSNRGPSIRSFQLKNYRQTVDPDSPPIELVHLENNTADFFLISFSTQTSIPDKTMAYEADHQNLMLENGGEAKDVVFHSATPEGLLIRQSFRFYPDHYRIDMVMDVVNQSQSSKEGVFVTDMTTLPPKKKSGYSSFAGLALYVNRKLTELKIEKASEQPVINGQIDWMAYEDGYFMSAIIPSEISQRTFKGSLLPSGLLKGSCLSPPISIMPSQQISSQYTLYFGPRDLAKLKEVGRDLDRAVEFGWFDIIAKGLLFVLVYFNKFINNYGVSIILLTVLIKILFAPLTHKSYKSMKEMQKLQPIMAKIRERHKDDKQKMNQEMMALYKTYKVNPMSGCLPMIIQIPVFIALFRLLGSSIELRHAPFFFWINDLSAPDRLFSFSFAIPFMTPPYGIPVLTLLMGASMFIQQKMTPTPGDPAQAKIMLFLPLIFTFMFINFPSGLVLYWFTNNILSIGQQYLILKKSSA